MAKDDIARMGIFGIPILGEGGLQGSAIVPFERTMVVSYRLSIVTIVQSLTIRPQFAVECLRRSNQQGVGQFDAKFGEKAVDRCKPMKLCRYLQLFEHSART